MISILRFTKVKVVENGCLYSCPLIKKRSLNKSLFATSCQADFYHSNVMFMVWQWPEHCCSYGIKWKMQPSLLLISLVTPLFFSFLMSNWIGCNFILMAALSLYAWWCHFLFLMKKKINKTKSNDKPKIRVIAKQRYCKTRIY